ncbi:hypothetical protein RB8689 [Rhodopirellula baltica SH 1]|uniref:Uncharacterized protein n=1 Tax=Rhodopirellula baltica (strain DSM 10527 / NCIMB 13988 / SH1) TaxID=243090 RepID=Q7UMP7_RHOBA|nr:hypothetical protein RB8689 [Rhodopirellula baltica SH 1]
MTFTDELWSTQWRSCSFQMLCCNASPKTSFRERCSNAETR